MIKVLTGDWPNDPIIAAGVDWATITHRVRENRPDMRLTFAALALTLSALPAFAAGPDLMGTWSANCKTQPPMRTLQIDFDSVQVVDRRCQFVRWTKTDIGWHSPLACSTEGHINTGQILVVVQSPSRILVDMDGLNGSFNRCPR